MNNSPLRSYFYFVFFLGSIILASITTGLGVYVATKQAAVDGTIAFLDRKAEDVQNLLDEASKNTMNTEYKRYRDQIEIKQVKDGCVTNLQQPQSSQYEVWKNGIKVAQIDMMGCFGKNGSVLAINTDTAYMEIDKPEGMGGYIVTPSWGPLYTLDLKTNMVQKVELPGLLGFASTADRYVFNAGNQVGIHYITENVDEFYPAPKVSMNLSNIQFSPTLDKVSFDVLPDQPSGTSTVNVLDLRTKTYVLEKTWVSGMSPIQWQNDGTFTQ